MPVIAIYVMHIFVSMCVFFVSLYLGGHTVGWFGILHNQFLWVLFFAILCTVGSNYVLYLLTT